MFLSVLNIIDRTINRMTLMLEPVAHVDIRKLGSRFPSVSTEKGKTLYRAKATYWALPTTPRLSRSTIFACYRSSAPWITIISERSGYFALLCGRISVDF